MASHLMLLAAIYQISDSLQVIGNGVLRGYKDTRSIFFITFTAYWLLGLPCGYVLALTDWLRPAMGPSGFWVGFIIGLTSAAILMMCRMRALAAAADARADFAPGGALRAKCALSGEKAGLMHIPSTIKRRRGEKTRFPLARRDRCPLIFVPLPHWQQATKCVLSSVG